MKKSMMFGLMCATVGICGVARSEVVTIPLEGGCDTLAYSANGGMTVEVALTDESYADATVLELDLGHNGAYVVQLKKDGTTVKTYNWVVTDATCEVAESDEAEAALDTREEKTIAGTAAETLTYSSDGWGAGGSGVTVGYSWDGDAAKTLIEATDSGSFAWTPTLDGRYVLSHVVENGTTETAVFVVNGLPGVEGNPWEIGEGVTAYVKEHVLYLNGQGEVAAFDGDAPWAEWGETLTGIGPLSKGIVIPASVAATLPISLAGGVPSGAIAPAGAERIEIANGKAYLGVSVCTNADLSATTEAWQQADIEDVRKEPDGTVTLTVPATEKQGFMILKSKSAK